MLDHKGKHSYSGKLGQSAPVQDSDRRGNDRVVFTATAEIVEMGSGARFSARTTDLSTGGCFVDTKIPFPVGTKVRVTLRKGKASFEAPGTVAYLQDGLGMGISFDDLASMRRSELSSWLSDMTGEHQAVRDDSQNPGSSAHRGAPDRAVLTRLIHLLIQKRILTEAEGTSVLQDPLL
jgi:PilZ domain